MSKQKHQFKSYYCAKCRQNKPCQLLTGLNSEWKSYCCACYYEIEQERATEYNSYERVLKGKQQEQISRIKQYQLLKNYLGCKKCGSLEVDACSLYERNKLVCQPCLIKKAGRGSSPVSFLAQEKWYQKHWGINLGKWLEKYGCLPINANCVRKRLKDKEHLSNCACLEEEAKETSELFANSLRKMMEKIKECACEASNKPRTPYYDLNNYGYTYCEKCETRISGAGKMGVIKNRNNPAFWGLKVSEKVLCLKYLAKLEEKMPISKKYTFNKYLKRYQ